MKVFLVDDEPLAIALLESKLSQVNGVQIVAKYRDVEIAIEHVSDLKPDVVFLDINMPGTNGLLAAEQMLEHARHLEIVFVTAYDDYAIQAFELHAIDYLLKPVSTERIAKTVERIKEKLNTRKLVSGSHQSRIQCFRHLKVTSPDGFILSWRTSKAQELFAFLLHRRNQPVRKDVILEALWPDIDLKKAHNQLYTTIYQIRKTLQNIHEAIWLESKNGCYEMKTAQQVAIDIVEWEAGIKEAPPFIEENLHHHTTLFEQYLGDYFEEHGYIWAEGESERLRTLWYHHALDLGEQLTVHEQFDTAFEVYRRLKEKFPYSEKVYFHMMKMFEKMGDRTAVERCYSNLQQMLKNEFGMPPQSKTVEWYHGFIRQTASTNADQ